MRLRDLGGTVGVLPTGKHNAITDVDGVLVGHTTLDDEGLHTGVTAIVPQQLRTRRTLPAAVYVGNGYGKLVGSTQVEELGEMESPIVLTGTLSVFRAADAVLTHLMELYPQGLSFNPLVGETNDGHLSDIRRRPITETHVLQAIKGATDGPAAEGCVGAGTGTCALGFKAGIGTSSRLAGQATVGVLVQSNFGGVLTVRGTPIPAGPDDRDHLEPPGNSCMIVVATDAPLDARQLKRLARRAVFAMGRVGASYSNGSGDYAIAFSTSPGDRFPLPDNEISPLFTAVLDATEEAVLNSLIAARTTTGFDGRTVKAVPHDVLRRALSA